jgi:hypothetical protein
MAVFTLVPFLAAFRARLSAPRVSAPVLRILGASPDGAYVSPFGTVVGPLLRSVGLRAWVPPSVWSLGRAPSALRAIELSLTGFPGCCGSAACSTARGPRAVPPFYSCYSGRFSRSGSRRVSCCGAKRSKTSCVLAIHAIRVPISNSALRRLLPSTTTRL